MVAANRRRSFGRCGYLKSARTRSLGVVMVELEIIIVEDGGTESQPLAEAFAAASGRRLNYLASRQGRSRAGNVGLNAARGELLGFLDDDDQSQPARCRRPRP